MAFLFRSHTIAESATYVEHTHSLFLVHAQQVTKKSDDATDALNTQPQFPYEIKFN